MAKQIPPFVDGDLALSNRVYAGWLNGVNEYVYGPANVKADGVTDDTAALQAAVDALQANGGGILQLPPGQIKLTGNITITWPNATVEGGPGHVVLRGAGSGLTVFLDYRTSAATGGLISYAFSGYTEAQVNTRYLMTWIGGFSILRMVNYTTIAGDTITPGTGVGLYLYAIVGGQVQDVQIRGHETCMTMQNCLGGAVRDCLFSQANIGLFMASATPSTPGGLDSPPNAVVVDHCSINITKTAGLDITGGNVGVKGCNFSFNGVGGTNSGAIRNRYQTILPKQLTVDHTMFESNCGLGDIVIDGSSAVTATAMAVSNCTFIRNYPTVALNATNNIIVVLGASAYCDFVALNNGFKRMVGTAGAGTKNIDFVGLGYQNTRSVMMGNTFTDLNDSPVPGGAAVSGALVTTSLALQSPDGVYAPTITPVTGSNWLDIADAMTVIGGSGGGLIPNDNNSEFLGLPASLTARHWAGVFSREFFVGDTEISIHSGSGAPSGSDGKPIGTLYLNTAGGASTTLYVKTGASTYTAK